VLLGISILFFFVSTFLPSSNRITHGFAAYYTASRLVLEHRSGPIFYDDDAFRSEVEHLTNGQASDIYWANPPTASLMFLPLAFLSPVSARRMSMWLLLIFLTLAITVLARTFLRFSHQVNTFYVVTSVFLISTPLAKNFELGQVYILLLGLYGLALYALRSDVDWLAGLCLGLVLAFKAAGIPLLLLLAVRRRWRLIAWIFLSFMVAAIMSLPLIGISTWQIYAFQAVPSLLSDPVISVTAYQTLPGFVHHLFAYDPVWNPLPLVNSAGFAVVLNWLITFVFMIAAGVASWKASLEWLFCIGLILSLILVPVAEQHHYVLLFPAFLLAFSSPDLPCLLLLIAAALVALPLPFTSPAMSQGWLALLAYPRLYSAVILFSVLLYNHKIFPDHKAESINALYRA